MNEEVAHRYAAALAGVALEQRNAEAVRAGLEAFTEAFETVAGLRNFLESPAATEESKLRVIAALANRMGLDPALRNFLSLVVSHRRTGLLREIAQAFREELNERLGIADAEVISARELSDEDKRELTMALERRTGKRIQARFTRDESLLGGAVVRVGSTIYDGSVRERLARLRARLESE